jgi:hypothetical protein
MFNNFNNRIYSICKGHLKFIFSDPDMESQVRDGSEAARGLDREREVCGGMSEYRRMREGC